MYMCWGRSNHLAVYFQQVGFFQGLETEIIESIVPVIDDGGIQQFGIVMNDRPDIVREQGKLIYFLLSWQLYSSSMVPETFDRVLMQVAHRDAAGQQGIIGMADGEGSGCLAARLSSSVVSPRHIILRSLSGYVDGIYETPVQAVAELFDAGRVILSNLTDSFFLFLLMTNIYN